MLAIGAGVGEGRISTGGGGDAAGQRALDFLVLHGVPVSATSFEVALTYAEGRTPELNQRIDAQAAAAEPINLEFLEQLRQAFIPSAKQSETAVKAGDKMLAELGDVVSALKVAGARTNAYAETLSSTTTTLEAALDVKTLREVVAGLAAATLDMAEHNRSLTGKLEESTREIATLQDSLIAARAESMTDALTGLANRRMLREAMTLRLREAAAQKTPLCFLMCDIDHFKRVNDTWGHQTGDQIIRFIATSLKRHVRPDSLCARYGGEEFAVLMPRVGLNDAQTAAEAMRVAIEAKKLHRKSTSEDLGRVTISIGVAQWRPDESPEALIERADACLYASKRGGRNRVTIDRQLAQRARGSI